MITVMIMMMMMMLLVSFKMTNKDRDARDVNSSTLYIFHVLVSRNAEQRRIEGLCQ